MCLTVYQPLLKNESYCRTGSGCNQVKICKVESGTADSLFCVLFMCYCFHYIAIFNANHTLGIVVRIHYIYS